jgi:Trp operon repressor
LAQRDAAIRAALHRNEPRATIMQRFGVSRYVVYAIAKRHGLVRPRDPDAVRRLAAEGVPRKEIQERLGVSDCTMWRALGPKLDPDARKHLRGYDRDAIIAALRAGESGRSIARRLGCGQAVITKARKDAGLPSRIPKPKPPRRKLIPYVGAYNHPRSL